ncbi:MAG: lysophospholipid acyltransferase family protein [Bacteroidales bacterium]|nr:lysophospholipid acyltransferase family protein [Bacteroidales bacterium]
MKTFWSKFVWGILRLLGRKSLKRHYRATRFVSWVFRKIHYREYVIYTNLARSFPDVKCDGLRQMVNDFYQHLAEIFVEFLYFGASDQARLERDKLVQITNGEVLNNAFMNSASVTVLNSHAGNWELVGGVLGYFTAPEKAAFNKDEMMVTYLKLHSPLWDEIFKKNRCAPVPGYTGLLESMDVIKYELQHKNEKKIYIHNNDQYPYAQGVDIGNFLNQPTIAMMATINLAHKLHHSVLYMNMNRVSQGHYEWSFEVICEDASTMEPIEIARKYYDLLERDIRNNPMNYIWSHKRWK